MVDQPLKGLAIILMAAVVVSVSCVTGPPVLTNYSEISGVTLYDSSEFMFSFDEVQKWEVLHTERDTSENYYGMPPGTVVETIYEAPGDMPFNVVVFMTINDQLERLAMVAVTQYGPLVSIWDRWQDTDKWYEWSEEEYLKAHPDEIEPTIEKTVYI